MTNKVEISGKIYNSELRTTPAGKTVVRFGLSVYAGKDKEGKSTYQFVNCKYWGDGIENGRNIDIVGKIAFDVWQKDGKQNVRPFILVDSFSDHVKKEVAPASNNQQGELEGW